MEYRFRSLMLCFTGVSGAILNAAGQSVVDECKKHSKAHITILLMTYHLYTHPCDIWKHGFNVMFLNIWFFIGPLVTGSVLLTGAGNLNCDHIAHISGSRMITRSILNVLQLCESKQAATVSIPALGTGKIMCFIFCIFLSTTTTSTYPHL